MVGIELKRGRRGRERDRFHGLGWPDGQDTAGQSEASERELEERERDHGVEEREWVSENETQYPKMPQYKKFPK
jgi:hypothetical protein